MHEQKTRPKQAGHRHGRPRPAPFLFLVLEASRPTSGSARFALDDVDVILIGRGTERSCVRRTEDGARVLDLRVPDPWMSRAHARLTRRGGTLELTDLGSSNGSALNGLPTTAARLHDHDVLELGHSFFVFRAELPVGDAVGDILDCRDPGTGLRTVVPMLEQRLFELVRIAPTAVSVVLHGPSGSGKEVLATTVHQQSRRTGRLVAVNCGAIPAELVESELFGHRRGAFSGATTDRVGLIAAADGGTLFLDEIGDLPLAVQPALLRALQERAVLPVGADTPVPVDFRLISATHRDLDAMVAAGAFREDLWARLRGYVFEVPALAARREDLATLMTSLLGRHAPGRDITLTAPAAAALLRHDWPQNVRELDKTLESALALAGAEPLDLHHLPAGLAGTAVPRAADQLADGSSENVPAVGAEDPRRALLIAALQRHSGNISAVARELGRPRSQIQRWMTRWDLRRVEAS